VASISRICSNLKSGSSFLKLHPFLSDGMAMHLKLCAHEEGISRKT
jgi:hypothetical protein